MTHTRPIGGRTPGCVRPQSDAERVLGQIARGEVIAGRTGARMIAARAQAAYGDVWNHRVPTPASTAADHAGTTGRTS